MVGSDGMEAELGQLVEPLGEILLGPGEPVEEQQRHAAGAGFGHAQVQAPNGQRMGLHPPPPRAAGSFRSPTWSAGGTSMCTGWPRSYSSRVAITESGPSGSVPGELGIIL